MHFSDVLQVDYAISHCKMQVQSRLKVHYIGTSIKAPRLGEVPF